MGGHEVESGAIAAAMRMVEALNNRTDIPADEFEAAVRAEVVYWGLDTLTKALLLLIGVGFSVVTFPDDEPELRFRIIGAGVDRLHRLRLEEVPDELLPTVAGAYTAAVLGQDVYAWRASLGPIPDGEWLVWLYATWLMVESLEDYLGEGEFGRIVVRLTER